MMEEKMRPTGAANFNQRDDLTWEGESYPSRSVRKGGHFCSTPADKSEDLADTLTPEEVEAIGWHLLLR